MRALDFLGMLFAWAMHFGVQMPGVGAPMIRIKAGEPEGLQQRFKSEKDIICAAPKNIRQDCACVMISGHLVLLSRRSNIILDLFHLESR